MKLILSSCRSLHAAVLNAHPIKEGTGPGAQTRIEYDHKHKGERVRFYLYKDASTLLSDFWQEVELILQERSLK